MKVNPRSCGRGSSHGGELGPIVVLSMANQAQLDVQAALDEHPCRTDNVFLTLSGVEPSEGQEAKGVVGQRSG